MKTKSILTVALFAFATSILSAQEATIARLAGTESVTVTLPSGEDVMMGQGDVIPVGAWVEVASGKLFLRTFQGTVSVFSSGSVFEVTEIETSGGKEKTRLTLQSGDMVANLDPNKRDVNDYGVVTPKGVAAARGTNYTVSVNGVNVVVVVVNGVVSVDIPDVGMVSLNPGQATSGGLATSISNVLSGGDAAAAAATRTALQAAAAAVSSLVASGVDGVTAGTLDSVIGVIAEVANESNDSSVLTEATSAAVVADPNNAQAVVRSAVRSRPAAAQAIVAAATQAVVSSADPSAPADVQSVADELSGAANSELESTGAPVESNEVVEDVADAEEAPPEIEVPNDNADNAPNLVTFTIRLSGGRFLAVTVNDSDDSAVVLNSPSVVGAQTAQVGDGSRVVFDVPASVIQTLGRSLTPAQRTNIDAGITAVLGNLPVIEVPNDTIIISPSS